MNQSINTANFDGNEMANDIWAMLGAPENTAENAFKMPHQAIVSSEENSMNNAPDLANRDFKQARLPPSRVCYEL